MTRDEAVKILKELAGYEKTMDLIQNYSVSVQDALYMAIKALEQESKAGHWVDSNSFLMVVIGDTVVNLPAKECSICHKPHIKGYGADFCPNCGAKMVERG